MVLRKIFYFAFTAYSLPFIANGQGKTVKERTLPWVACLTSARFSEKYSFWNDFHYLPETFGVARTGLTRHFSQGAVTAGYAHVWLNSGSARLNRTEHRPWAQVQFFVPVSGPYVLNQRFRYDARFRQKVVSGETTDEYNFNHRIRFQMVLRRNFPALSGGKLVPFLSLSDEVLLNFGKEITFNTFDQNRASFAFGLQRRHQQIQVGYMNRFAQSAAPGHYLQDHVLILWVTQNFDLRRPKAGFQAPSAP